jgi:hypothetical protein
MIPKKPAPDLIRGGTRFFGKDHAQTKWPPPRVGRHNHDGGKSLHFPRLAADWPQIEKSV